MKKLINIFCAMVSIAITFCTANAQTIAFQPNNKPANKTIAATGTAGKIADNVQRKFSKRFPGITAESWSKTDNGYAVEFKNGNVQNRVFLTGKGNLNYQISYYSEAELPADIRKRVKNVYFDYTIFCVQEINTDRTKIYLVVLEDKNSWKIVRVDENEMEVYKEYVKA